MARIQVGGSSLGRVARLCLHRLLAGHSVALGGWRAVGSGSRLLVWGVLVLLLLVLLLLLLLLLANQEAGPLL